MGIRTAVDIGGTFTDLVAIDEETGRLFEGKVLTHPSNPAAGVLEVIDRSPSEGLPITHFLHGTTLVINALTERKGTRTALLTTAGFGDLLEIQRCNRRDMYNLRYTKPRPFVPRSLVYEVRERISANGTVLIPLSEEDVRAAARWCAERGIQALAVCFLNAYANPENELRCREILEETLSGIPITLSHELTREWREFERATTAVLNAYVQPTVAAYLGDLDAALTGRDVNAARHVMQSNGRVTTFRGAARFPIRLVESGPVAGVMGATAIATALDLSDLISLDIGGTTAKASLIRDGRPALHTEYYIERDRIRSGYPLKVPTVDIVEVGAGGGSIAHLDPGGRLLVGPESAGADPGPACYGRGGIEPTVTDAFLLAGVLDPEYFLGGALRLVVEAAEEAYARLAGRIGSTVDETALGVIRLANASMANLLRLISVHRGHDPRTLALLAMGGGGPMHASMLARELGIRRVIVPPRSGVFSAYGMLHADVGVDLVRTRLFRLDAVDAEATLTATFEAMAEDALKLLAASGIRVVRPTHLRSLDMRYKGQEHTVEVHLPAALTLVDLAARFHDAHERQYTFRLDDPVEVVNFRLTAEVPLAKPLLTAGASTGGRAKPVAERPVRFDLGRMRTPIYRRELLVPGMAVEGPAVIEEPTTTIVLLPGDRLEVHATGSLVIQVGDAL